MLKNIQIRSIPWGRCVGAIRTSRVKRYRNPGYVGRKLLMVSQHGPGEAGAMRTVDPHGNKRDALV